MKITPQISFPPRTGHYGMDVLNAVIAIVRNRTGRDFHTVYNRCLAANRELMADSYSSQDAARNMLPLLTRVEKRTGLSGLRPAEMAIERIGLLTNRFVPALAVETTARQWDILHRAAQALEKEGAPERLMNRVGKNDTGICAADWNAALSRAADVFGLLDSEATEAAGPVNVGKKFQSRGYGSAMICRAFRSMVKTLMAEQKISCREAFDQIKEEQPLFWTMAMLSFDQEPG